MNLTIDTTGLYMDVVFYKPFYISISFITMQKGMYMSILIEFILMYEIFIYVCIFILILTIAIDHCSKYRGGKFSLPA